MFSTIYWHWYYWIWGLVHVCVHGAGICVCTCMWRSEVHTGRIPESLSILFPETRSGLHAFQPWAGSPALGAISILEMRHLRHRKVKELIETHTALNLKLKWGPKLWFLAILLQMIPSWRQLLQMSGSTHSQFLPQLLGSKRTWVMFQATSLPRQIFPSISAALYSFNPGCVSAEKEHQWPLPFAVIDGLTDPAQKRHLTWDSVVLWFMCTCAFHPRHEVELGSWPLYVRRLYLEWCLCVNLRVGCPHLQVACTKLGAW